MVALRCPKKLLKPILDTHTGNFTLAFQPRPAGISEALNGKLNWRSEVGKYIFNGLCVSSEGFE